MALEGNLSSFGLSEILQLIAVQKKTGMLTVSMDNSTTVLFFRDGEIISTRDRRRRSRDPFKEYLTRYGILSREELIRITQISSKSKLDLTDILASEGFLTEDELKKQWRKQIQEAMHDVLTWEQCSYKFISSEEIVSGIRSVGEYSIEAMLMESMRRIDEFPQMLDMFPSDQILIMRAEKKIKDKDMDDMTSNEKFIVGLLTATLSMRDLIARGKMPLFEVYEALKHLKDKGLIKVKDERPEDVAAETSQSRSRERVRKMRRNVFPLVGAVLLFAGAGFFGFRGTIDYVTAGNQLNVSLLQNDDLARRQLGHKLRWLIETYRAENGVYPSSLKDLQAAGLADGNILNEAEAHSFRYRLTPGRPAYTLL